jgi:cytochrome c5
MRVRWNLIALSALTIASAALLAACGNQSAPTTNGAGETATKPAETKPETAKDPDAAKGKLVFIQTGCNACHMNSAVGDQYPDLRGLYGAEVKLKDGTDRHRRRSIPARVYREPQQADCGRLPTHDAALRLPERGTD